MFVYSVSFRPAILCGCHIVYLIIFVSISCISMKSIRAASYACLSLFSFSLLCCAVQCLYVWRVYIVNVWMLLFTCNLLFIIYGHNILCCKNGYNFKNKYEFACLYMVRSVWMNASTIQYFLFVFYVSCVRCAYFPKHLYSIVGRIRKWNT